MRIVLELYLKPHTKVPATSVLMCMNQIMSWQKLKNSLLLGEAIRFKEVRFKIYNSIAVKKKLQPFSFLAINEMKDRKRAMNHKRVFSGGNSSLQFSVRSKLRPDSAI